MKQGVPLGDRMKDYESFQTSQKLYSQLPVIARMDGRAFHSFCRPFAKPFDEGLIFAMDSTCIDLVKEFNADLGYVQSDEITLVFLPKDLNSQLPFGGREFKLQSVLASFTSVSFMKHIKNHEIVLSRNWLDGRLPHFDARVFNVPNIDEAANAVLWRILDAEKNSIQMLGQAHFSHKQLHGLKGGQIKTKLEEEQGVVWGELPSRRKSGTLVKRVVVSKVLQGVTYHRSNVVTMDVPRKLVNMSNKTDVLFSGADPIYKQEE